jgi:hypothetical protein
MALTSSTIFRKQNGKLRMLEEARLLEGCKCQVRLHGKLTAPVLAQIHWLSEFLV